MIYWLLSAVSALFVFDAVRHARLGSLTFDQALIWLSLSCLVFGGLLLSPELPRIDHPLRYSGAAFLALTLGYGRGLLSVVVLLALTRPFGELGLDILIDAVLPVWLMIRLVRISRRYLPANPFIFLLGLSFFGLFIVLSIQVLVGAAARAWVQGHAAYNAVMSEHTAWHLLLASGETILEGMILTILVVYYPRAVALFDDQFYLSRPM